MRSIIFLSIFFFSISFMSCESNDLVETVDIINVARDNAVIPAYIYGNVSSDVFIVLLHGGPGGSGLGYRGGIYSDLLESDYAVVYTDQRAQGMSQGNFSSSTLTPEHLAGDVYALGLALKEKYGNQTKLFLMGHSWGGLLGSAVMVDETYSSIFDAWIEVDGAHDMPLTFTGGIRKLDTIANEEINNNRSIDYWSNLQNTISGFDSVNIELEDFSELNGLCYDAEERLRQDRVIAEVDGNFAINGLVNSLFINNGITTFISSLASNSSIINNGLIEYSFTDQLENIDKPTLLLWGKYDSVVPLELAFQAYNKIGVAEQDKEILIFNNSGHSPMVTEPLLFYDTVSSFIEKHR